MTRANKLMSHGHSFTEILLSKSVLDLARFGMPCEQRAGMIGSCRKIAQFIAVNPSGRLFRACRRGWRTR
jgi:hypothetical protein